MIDGDDNLTYAGLLLSDECDLLQSRVFVLDGLVKVREV